MDFGPARFINSKNFNLSVLIYDSKVFPDKCYKFICKGEGRYRCVGCKQKGMYKN